MLTLALALAVSATSPAGVADHLAGVSLGQPGNGVALVIAEGTSDGVDSKPADKGGAAKKPGATMLKGKELDFMERYAPFNINDGAAEPVQKNFMFVHLLGCLPLGGLWAPLLLYPTAGRPELGTDQLISYLIPMAITWGAVVGFSVVAWVPAFFFPPCGLIGCLGCPLGLAGWWVSNNASMNAWDRAYKGRPLAENAARAERKDAVAMAY